MFGSAASCGGGDARGTVGGGVRGGGKLRGCGGGWERLGVRNIVAPANEDWSANVMVSSVCDVEIDRDESSGCSKGFRVYVDVAVLSREFERVGECAGLIWFSGTVSMFSEDWRTVCVPIPPGGGFLAFRLVHKRLARLVTSDINEGVLELWDDPLAAFRL